MLKNLNFVHLLPLFISLVFTLNSAQADDLIQRGSLGFRHTQNDDGKREVASVNPDSPAEAAGVQVGDILVSLNGRPIYDVFQAAQVLHSIMAGQTLDIVLNRGGDEVSLSMQAEPMPFEELENAQVEYKFFQLPSGQNVRTIQTFPSTSSFRDQGNGKVPAVFMVQGFPCTSIETLNNPNHIYSKLIMGFNDLGFATLRAEKPGVGGSDGPDGKACLDSGYYSEVEAFGAALEEFRKDSRVDSERIFLVGISMGAFEASMISEISEVKGIVSWGGGIGPWYDYLLWINRLQNLILEEPIEEIEAYNRDYRILMGELIVHDKTPEEFSEEFPEVAERMKDRLGALDWPEGRHYTFHQEIDKAPIMEAWAGYKGNVLVLHGGLDRVSLPWDHSRVADVVNTYSEGHADFVVLDGLSHTAVHFETLKDTLSGAQGEQTPLFYDTVFNWLKTQVNHSE